MPGLRRVFAVVAAMVVATLVVPSHTASALSWAVAGECDMVLRAKRQGNGIVVSTEHSFCVTNEGVGTARMTIDAVVPGLVGWTCLGGGGSGGATITVSHADGVFVAEDVIFDVAEAVGAVTVRFDKIAGGQRVAGSGALVEPFTGPVHCLSNTDEFLWRGAVAFAVGRQ